MGANFTPSWNKYSDIKPFRFWCQKVLPSVYDDSLSYYELLCKVVAILNEVIDNMTAVEENTDAILVAFEQLQDYVNNYFADANMSELVNAALDEMATSGELENLVKPYFDSWIEEAEAWAKGTKDGTPVTSDEDQYHNNAKYYAEQGESNKEQSEAWAKGTINGTPVTSDADQYQNNSKYYAEQAAEAAQNATYANEAQAWATGSVNGTPVSSDAPQHENNAEYYANQAAQAAHDATYSDEAQAWATGSVNGTPVGSGAVQYHNNSKYYAEQAAQAAQDATYANEAQAWATGEVNGTPVASTADQYENNAKYYAEQAGQAAQAVVADAVKYGIGNAAYGIYYSVQVKKDRTFYRNGTHQITLDIPGLVVVLFPFPDTGSSTPLVSQDGVNFSDVYSEVLSAVAFTTSTTSPIFRSNRYLIQPMSSGISFVTNVDGKSYVVHFLTVWDYVAGDWAADGTTFNMELLLMRTYYSTAGTVYNTQTIDL